MAQASALLATAAVVMVAAEVATRAREATLVTGLAVAEGYWAEHLATVVRMEEQKVALAVARTVAGEDQDAGAHNSLNSRYHTLRTLAQRHRVVRRLQ